MKELNFVSSLSSFDNDNLTKMSLKIFKIYTGIIIEKQKIK